MKSKTQLPFSFISYLAKQRKQQQRRGDGGDDDADDEASKYRDRAAERRKMETENVEDEE